MQQPTLSIIVVIHNVRPFLPALLASLLGEVPPEAEYVFVDDGSTDGSADQVEETISTLDNCILYRQPKNLGLSSARNKGLEIARGRYVWFVDGDDAVHPGGQGLVLAAIQQSGADIVAFDAARVYERTAAVVVEGLGQRRLVSSVTLQLGERLGRTLPAGTTEISQEQMLEALVRDDNYYAWSLALRRELATLSPFSEGRYFEDISVAPIWQIFAESVFYVPEIVLLYRQRSGSILSRMSLGKLLDFAGAVGVAYRAPLVAALPSDDPRRDGLLALWLKLLCAATSEMVADGWIGHAGAKRDLKAALDDLRQAVAGRLPNVLRRLRRSGQRRAALAGSLLLVSFATFHVLYRIRWSLPVRKLLARPDDRRTRRYAFQKSRQDEATIPPTTNGR